MKPLVGIIMGSQSDWDTMRAAAETLDSSSACRIETRVVSAHRTPDLLFEYASTRARARPRSHHRRRRRRGPSARHDGRRRPRCRCSACRCSRRRSTASTRCSRSCRCRRAFRSPRSPSAWRARRNAALFAAADPREQASRRSRAALEQFRARADRQACSQNPDPAARRDPRHDHRHRRRRPARPHARAGGLSARARLPVPRSGRGRARRPGRAASSRRVQRRGTSSQQLAREAMCSRSTGRTSRSTRCARSAAAHAYLPAAAALGAAQDRVQRESSSFERLQHSDHALAPRSIRAQTRARRRGDRPARRAEDAPPRLRRQGPGRAAQAADVAARLGSARQRAADLRRASCPSTTRSRSSACAAAAARSPFYPLNGNVHATGILRSLARRIGTPRCSARRSVPAARCCTHFDYAGVLTIEFFVAARAG